LTNPELIPELVKSSGHSAVAEELIGRRVSAANDALKSGEGQPGHRSWSQLVTTGNIPSTLADVSRQEAGVRRRQVDFRRHFFRRPPQEVAQVAENLFN